MAIATSKFASVTIIALCQVAAMALWFSASAVLPALLSEYKLTGFAQAALTSGVQAGFVLGCLVSAFLGLPDRVDPRRLFAVSTLIGAAANGCCSSSAPHRPSPPLLRFVTGVALAGVYPVGMKLAATWAKGDMGLMVGILVGALTLGSAVPHLFNAFGGIEWRIPVGRCPLLRVCRRAADRIRRHRPQSRADAAVRSARGVRRRGATSRCGSPTSATSATCGSSTRCGRGSACS